MTVHRHEFLVRNRVFNYSRTTYHDDDHECPYQILGISKSSSFHHVKRKFLQLALQTHPDVSHTPKDITTICSIQEQQEKQRFKKQNLETFIRYRNAFETILSLSTKDKRDTSKDDSDDEEEKIKDILTYNYNMNHSTITGDLSNLDSETLQEIAHVSQHYAPGGLDRGGLWAYAHQIRHQ